MKSDKRYTPEQIVDNSLVFSIPLYQRMFSWGTTQVEKLLYDLYDHYTGPTPDEPYYLGQMTVARISDHLSLIDGQQRFTIMILLGLVLKKYDNNWQTFLEVDHKCRLSFVGREEDQNYIQEKIDQDKKTDYRNTKMESALSCIEQFLMKLSEKDCKGLANHIYKNMSFFLSELPDSYMHNPSSLNKYFEAMNSTGKGLESYEILKVDLLRGCEDQEYLTKIWNLVSRIEQPLIGYNKESESIEQCRANYKEAIKYCMKREFGEALKYMSDIKEDKEPSLHKTIAEIEARPLDPYFHRIDSESSVLTFPDFLLLVLDLTIGEDNEVRKNQSDFDFYNKDKLLTRFKDYKPKIVKDFYDNLLFYRLLLDFYVDRVEYIQGEGHHYLLFSDEYKESNNCLKQYEAMLHVSTDNYYEWLKPFMIYLRDQFDNVANSNPSSSELLSKLKEIDDKRHPIIGIENLNYGIVDRYWFWRLDYYIWEKRSSIFKEDQLKAVNNYEFRANRSIEHLHPQDESQNIKWKEYDLNRFGNLAMISQSFNSTQSNDSVKVKFARIEDQVTNGNLQSLKLYIMYLSANKSPDGWNEKAAEKIELEMYTLLEKSFNRCP